MLNCSRYLLLAFLGLAVVAAGCRSPDGVVFGTAGAAGDPDSFLLWTDGQVQVGRVDVWDDWSSSPASLHVKYVLTEPNWLLTECRLAAALELESIPQKNGNPDPRNFEWDSGTLNGVTEFEFAIPFEDGWDGNRVLHVAPYCELVPYKNGRPGRAESGWGGSEPFAGRKWAVYCLYRIGDGTPSGTCFRTVTQGHWGAPPETDYWGRYLAFHFDQEFCPDLRVGYGCYLLLSDAPSAETYLPDYGAPTKLTKPYRDPKPGISVYAGQVVALLLNVTFDAADPDFAPSELLLKDLYVADPASPFYGWTVQSVLDEANEVLGGHGNYTPAVMNVCATRINENFKDLGDNGFLSVTLP